jgi:hypothetical protein
MTGFVLKVTRLCGIDLEDYLDDLQLLGSGIIYGYISKYSAQLFR